MGQPTEISEGKVQLLVEGKDQKNFFEALLRHIGLQNNVQIQDYGGGDELHNFLPAFAKMPKFKSMKSIGIVRDAENSEQATFQSVQLSIRNANLISPSQVGTASSGNPTVTVLILPGGGRRGMLETIICRVFADKPIDNCIDDFFNCAQLLPDVSITSREKSRAYTYLATTSRPFHSVGVAAKAGVWDLDHPAFNEVRDFLSRL